MDKQNEEMVVVSDDAFKAASEALTNGEQVVPTPAKAVTVKKTKGKSKTAKKKEPKVRKNLTVHKHWLIDIRRFAETLGIKEGQALTGRTKTKNGVKILELEFI